MCEITVYPRWWRRLSKRTLDEGRGRGVSSRGDTKSGGTCIEAGAKGERSTRKGGTPAKHPFPHFYGRKGLLSHRLAKHRMCMWIISLIRWRIIFLGVRQPIQQYPRLWSRNCLVIPLCINDWQAQLYQKASQRRRIAQPRRRRHLLILHLIMRMSRHADTSGQSQHLLQIWSSGRSRLGPLQPHILHGEGLVRRRRRRHSI